MNEAEAHKAGPEPLHLASSAEDWETQLCSTPDATGQSRRAFLRDFVAALGGTRALKYFGPILPALLTGCGRGHLRERGNTLVIGITVDVRTLDPGYQIMALDSFIIALIHETLTFYDFNLNMVGRLAESWKTEDKGLSWLVRVKPGVKFHDGLPCTAEAVKFSLDRIKDPDTKSNRFTKVVDLDQVDVVDDLTVRFRMKRPMSLWPNNLRSCYSSIVSPTKVRSFADQKDYTNGPVGTGPFRFVEWRRDQLIAMERFPDHREAKRIQFDRLEFRPYRESNIRVVMLEQGRIDVCDVPYANVPVLKSEGKVNMNIAPQLAVRYVGLNFGKPPFSDVRVRRAVNMGMDYDTIIDRVLKGGFGRLYGPLPSNMPAFAKDATRYHYDPAAAKELLAQAGYAKGLDVTLWGTDTAFDKTMGETLKSQLEGIGVNVNLMFFDRGVYWKRFDKYMSFDGKRFPTREGVFDMFLAGWVGGEHPYDYLDPLLRSTSSSNNAFYSNPKVDALLDSVLATVDEAEHQKYYHEIQKIVTADAPWIFALQPKLLMGVNKRVVNYRLHPAGEYELWDLSLMKSQGEDL